MNDITYSDFCNDAEKMADFRILTKSEFLRSYSYLTEKEYDLTASRLAQKKRILILPIDGNDDFILEVHVKDTCETSDADILQLMEDANYAWCNHELDLLTSKGLDIGDWDFHDNIDCVCCSEFIIDILDLNLDYGDVESWYCYDNIFGSDVEDFDDLDFGDLFFFNDDNGTLEEVYINWDCSSGQAIIETSYDYDLILRAYEEEPDPDCFWERLNNDRALDIYHDHNSSIECGDMYDDNGNPVTTDEYRDLKRAYINIDPDFRFKKVTPLSDFSEATMKLIVAHARHWKECHRN